MPDDPNEAEIAMRLKRKEDIEEVLTKWFEEVCQRMQPPRTSREIWLSLQIMVNAQAKRAERRKFFDTQIRDRIVVGIIASLLSSGTLIFVYNFVATHWLHTPVVH